MARCSSSFMHCEAAQRLWAQMGQRIMKTGFMN